MNDLSRQVISHEWILIINTNLLEQLYFRLRFKKVRIIVAI